MTTETLPVVRPIEVRERTASDVLLAAARYIEEHGWWQMGRPHPGGHPACVMTAIGHVTNFGRDDANERLMGDALGKLRRLVGHMDEWNDAPERVEAEVLAALRTAAR